MTEVSCNSLALPHKSHCRSSNEAINSSLHILCNSFYNTILSFDYKQSGLLTTLLGLWVIMPYMDSIRLLASKVLTDIYDHKVPAQAVPSPYVNTRVLIFDTHTQNQPTNRPTNLDGQKKNSLVNRLHKPHINTYKWNSIIWYETQIVKYSLQWIVHIRFTPLRITQVADTCWTSTGNITYCILRENTRLLS
jgi:hypothetical protein